MNFLLLLLLMVAATMTLSTNFSSPMPPKPGVYFNEESDILLKKGSWKLLMYKDLKPLYSASDSVKRTIENFKKMTANTKLVSAQESNIMLENSVMEIEIKLSQLSYYIGLEDGINDVLKWFTDLSPNTNNAKFYNNCINAIEQNKTKVIIENNFQIIPPSVPNFHESLARIISMENLIKEYMDRINKYITYTDKLMESDKIDEIYSNFLQIDKCLWTLKKDVAYIFINTFSVKTEGDMTIHPSIIDTRQIYEELLSSNHMRSDTKFVAPLKMSNIAQIVKSSTITAFVHANKLIFIIDLPLVHMQDFTLYHLYSIPIQQVNSSTSNTVETEHKYLAVSSTEEQYVTLNNLKNCKDLPSNRLICENVHVYNYEKRSTCEMEILLSDDTNIPENCAIIDFPANATVFEPIKDNKWIHILSNEMPFALECNGEKSHHVVRGAGILNLPLNCKLHKDNSTLSTTASTITKNVDIVVPDFVESYKEINMESLNNVNEPQKVEMSRNYPPPAKWYSWIFAIFALPIAVGYFMYRKYRQSLHNSNNYNNNLVTTFDCARSSVALPENIFAIIYQQDDSDCNIEDDEIEQRII